MYNIMLYIIYIYIYAYYQRKFRSLNSVLRTVAMWHHHIPRTIHHHNNTSPQQHIITTMHHHNNTSPQQFITTTIHHKVLLSQKVTPGSHVGKLVCATGADLFRLAPGLSPSSALRGGDLWKIECAVLCLVIQACSFYWNGCSNASSRWCLEDRNRRKPHVF